MRCAGLNSKSNNNKSSSIRNFSHEALPSTCRTEIQVWRTKGAGERVKWTRGRACRPCVPIAGIPQQTENRWTNFLACPRPTDPSPSQACARPQQQDGQEIRIRGQSKGRAHGAPCEAAADRRQPRPRTAGGRNDRRSDFGAAATENARFRPRQRCGAATR
jgi:hypothetical protein